MSDGTELYNNLGRYPSALDVAGQYSALRSNKLAQLLQQGQVDEIPTRNALMQLQLKGQTIANQRAQSLADLLGSDESAPQAPQAAQGAAAAAMPPAGAAGAPAATAGVPGASYGVPPVSMSASGQPLYFGHTIDTWGKIHANGGPDMSAQIKLLAEGAVAPPGSEVKDLRTGLTHTVVTLDKGQVRDPVTGAITNAPNFPQAQAETAGAVAGAQEKAKAAYTLLPPTYQGKGPDGQIAPIGGSVASYLGAQTPPPPGAPVGAPVGAAPPMAVSQLSPPQQTAAMADIASRGQDPTTMKVNGAPAFGDMQSQLDAAKAGGPAAMQRFVQTVAPHLNGNPQLMAGLAYDLHTPIGTPIHSMSAQGAPSAPAGAPPQLASSADIAAANLSAEQGVHATTDPVIALRKDIVTKSHAANQTFMDNLGDVVNNEAEIVSRNNRLQPLLAQVPNIGGFSYDQRADFANKLKNSGVLPQSVLDSLSTRIAGGDPDAAKVVQNQLSAAAIQTMLDTLNKEGKPNRVMYQALHEQQEGLAAGKPVLQNIMALQNQLYQQHLGQLSTATDLMSSPDYNPVKFQSQFATAKNASIQAPPPATVAPGSTLPPDIQAILKKHGVQ